MEINRRIVYLVGIVVLLAGLWASSIPHGIWLARNAYIQNTVAAKIAAVQAENAQLKQQLDAAKAADAAK